ncbi:LysR family transcriptional regulator [Paraferrimonas haliotis]|uniref:LysR family transcriptional regulator n=1 Tax=Paraferrimonas haliotis TaxID=2013866 RepID=A0AA37WWC2_9GAMM|nr:LysR family transcriptional regulator [Paraferrimonas haliotis]GLS83373.1 LysR family transcriptional regulator [Paraferrimonas haliotis]
MAIDSFAIRAFITIAKSGSMSKAATQLGSSHPTLSRTIAAMEDELGYQLFTREGAGKSVVLSPRGQRLLHQAKLTIETIDVFNDIAEQLFDDTTPKVLRLAIPDLISDEKMAGIVANIYKHWPSIEIELSQPSIFEGYGLLLAKKVDGLLAMREDALLKGIVIEPVGNISMSMYVHPQHPLALKDKVQTSDYTPHRLFWPKTGANDTSRLQWETWSLKTSYTQNFRQAAACAMQGLGVAPLPDHIGRPLAEANQLKLISLGTQNQESPAILEWMSLESYAHRGLMNFIAAQMVEACSN